MTKRALQAVVVMCTLAALPCHPPLAANAGPASNPLFGLQPFPYDMTLEAFNHVHDLAARESTLAIVHRDNGVPWAEALADRPFPSSLEREWRDLAQRIPAGRPVYLALGPLAEDRVSLAVASAGSSVPPSIANAPYDAQAVKKAYLNYARRAVARFRPRFLNLGIEAGELAARAPERWPAFVSLYGHVRAELKRAYPDMMIGISFGLPSLIDSNVAERAKPLVEASDFLGLSFYPYMSPFHERFGAPPLSPAPGQWQDALAWAAKYTNKPIAICETGYSARDVNLPAFNLHLTGTPALQEAYLRDLGEIAMRQKYLFVVWSIPVDYDALVRRFGLGDGRYQLWQSIGLFDGQLRARAPFEIWRQLVHASLANSAAEMVTTATAGAVEGGAALVSPLPVPTLVNGQAPSRLHASWSGTSLVLTWAAPTSGSPERYAIAGGDGLNPHRLPVVLTDDAATSHVLAPLPRGAYTLRVHAVGREGLSPASEDVTVTVGSASSALGPPVALQASIDGAVLRARWKPSPFGSAAPSTHLVEIDDARGGREVISVPASQHEISQQVWRPVHAIRVRASREGSVSGPSNEVIFEQGDRECRGAPAAPTLLPITVVDGEAVLRWLPATNSAERFRISIRHESDRSPVATLSSEGAATSIVLRLGDRRLVAAVVAETPCGSSRLSNEILLPAAEPVRP